MLQVDSSLHSWINTSFHPDLSSNHKSQTLFYLLVSTPCLTMRIFPSNPVIQGSFQILIIHPLSILKQAPLKMTCLELRIPCHPRDNPLAFPILKNNFSFKYLARRILHQRLSLPPPTFQPNFTSALVHGKSTHRVVYKISTHCASTVSPFSLA